VYVRKIAVLVFEGIEAIFDSWTAQKLGRFVLR